MPNKIQLLTNLFRKSSTDLDDSVPTTSYSLLVWDGDEVKTVTGTNVASTMFSASAFTTYGNKTTLNIGTAANSTAVEYGNGYNHVTVLTIPGFTQAIAGANLGFGKKIYDFPLGAVKCKRALINITMTAATDTTVGEIGLGTVIASGVITGLGGTATFENVVDGFANTAPAPTGGATQAQKECEADNPDGTSTALDLFLNFAGGWSATESLTIGGTIVLFWDYLGAF